MGNKIIKRIALVFPFQITSGGYNMESVKSKGQYTEAPLRLAYISAFVKMHGYDVKIFDAHMMAVKGFTTGRYSNLEEVESELVAGINEFRPDVVGISCLFHYTSRTAHRVMGRVKNTMKDIVAVMGGPYVTVSPEAALSDSNVDFVILGEGERAFLNLLEALNGRFSFSDLTSIGYRDKENKVVVKRGFTLLKSLDDNPLPDRTDFILEDYYKYGRILIQRFEYSEGKELGIATLTATRGCVFDCTFCINRDLWSRGLRFRDPENVLDEIEFLKKEHGIRYFSFNDDNLLIVKKFARKLLQGMIDRKLDIRWTTGGMSVCELDEEMIGLAVESGCLVFNLAIESANKETLKKIRKPVKIEKVIRVVEAIRKHKSAYIIGLFMVGFPEETEEQFFETIRFGESLRCDWTNYAILTPFPGSEIYREVKAKGMLSEDVESDFEKLDFRKSILNLRYLSSEFIEREVYLANLSQNFFGNPNLNNGKANVALSDFKYVAKLSPTHASAYYMMGKIHENRGEVGLAEQFFGLARANLSGLHKECFERLGINFPSS
ncbi:radical SAM protein [bacterium]|nr:MAG: radical SAM protein [bacterium]